MKTIIDSNNCSKYLFKNNKQVVFHSENIEIKKANKLLFIIGDLNENNSSLIEDISAPDDWVGCKYIFDGTNWELSLDWVEPEGDSE